MGVREKWERRERGKGCGFSSQFANGREVSRNRGDGRCLGYFDIDVPTKSCILTDKVNLSQRI